MKSALLGRNSSPPTSKYSRFKRQSLIGFDLAARRNGAAETLTGLLAEIQQIVTAGTLLVGWQTPPSFRPLLGLVSSKRKSGRRFLRGWPGRYMGGGAWWHTIKRILIIP